MKADRPFRTIRRESIAAGSLRPAPSHPARAELIAAGLLTPGSLDDPTPATTTSGPVLRAHFNWRHEQRRAVRQVDPFDPTRWR